MSPSRPRLGFELAIVAILVLAFLAPGLSRYSLVDPWETHYSEVARRMLQDHDWIHTDWQKEGFASKPVLTFWVIAASLKAHGIATNGGYSGEIVEDTALLGAVRLPFVLFGALGLVCIWFMLARLVSRRVAWLGVAVVGSTPFFALVARQAITDMTLVGCMMAAIAMFALAIDDGARPIANLWQARRLHFSALHLWASIVGSFLLWQAAYSAYYFFTQPHLAPGLRFPAPHVVLPLLILVLALGVTHWPYARLPHAPGQGWLATLLGARRLTTMRQVYLLWCFTFLGISILGKGPAALGIFGVVGFFYVLILGKWRAIVEGEFEIKRGLALMLAITVPWHLGMYLKEGLRFINEYFITHLWARAALGVDNEKGTFNYNLAQIGNGMFLWAGLVPAALASAVGIRADSPRNRAKLLIGVWAIATVAFFSLIQTKFHHYILPAVPALGLWVAFFIDDVLDRRVRFHPLYALVAVGIILLLTRDMMHEEKQWIEMFVFRYDRPWPSAAPWSIDTSTAFLALGLAGSGAVLALAWRSGRRGATFAAWQLIGVGLAIGLWAMHVYMPIAGTHWGMRECMRTYYAQRQIYGERVVYFGAHQAWEDWRSRGATYTIATMVPEHLQVGQPMTLHLQINNPDPKQERQTERELRVTGTATHIAGHEITVTFAAPARAEIAQFVAAGQSLPPLKLTPRRPVRAVDADRLVIWQGYWRGEVFWSGDEIMGWLPEMQTDWQMGDNDSKKLLKYLSDPTLAPRDRRYFVFTSGNVSGLGPMLPTERARATLTTLDTTSNKFQMGAFEL